MLIFHRIEIKNFVCFADEHIEPSVDPDKPLTVIMGGNGAGKTTFLQAVRWGMYGDSGLFCNLPEKFSLHPVDWVPNKEGIETKVAIEFETDGASNSESSVQPSSRKIYRLERSVTTIKIVKNRRGDEPDFTRKDEQISFKRKESDGHWRPHQAGIETVMNQLLPRDLADFFVMNADQATDYVGGTEAKEISRREVIQKTTDAVNSLLGINTFKDARTRVINIAHEFGRKATDVVGSGDLAELQEELEKLRIEKTELEEKLERNSEKKSSFEEQRERCHDDLMREARDSGSHSALAERKESNSRLLKSERQKFETCLNNLASRLKAPELLITLAGDPIARTYETLRPLHEKGLIPQKHIYFVRRLLQENRCVCGEDLSENSVARDRVEKLVEESQEDEKHANYLGKLYESTRDMMEKMRDAIHWSDQYRRESELLSITDSNISEFQNESKEIDEKLARIDQNKIRALTEEMRAFDNQLEIVYRDLAVAQESLDNIESKIKKLEQDIGDQQRRNKEANELLNSKSMADAVGEIILEACSTIQRDQIQGLSEQMDKLFFRMTSGVSTLDTDKNDFKVPLRMITKVGLRPTDDDSEKFEIFAHNVRERSMLPTEINGASRRIIALSFVLALCEESQTKAPLVADSLLNFADGPVRKNVLLVAAKKSIQPILLLTGSDLETSAEVDAVDKYAGATYTLTADREDVVNFASDRPISLVCKCGPRQYCSVCEKHGQKEAPGWVYRDNNGGSQ